MNEQILLFITILLTVTITSSLHTQIPDQKYYLDAGIGFGNEVEAFGIKGGAVYRVNTTFRTAADGPYFFFGQGCKQVEI